MADSGSWPGKLLDARTTGTYRRVQTIMLKLGWTALRMKIEGQVLRGYVRSGERMPGERKVIKINFPNKTYEVELPNDDEEEDESS